MRKWFHEGKKGMPLALIHPKECWQLTQLEMELGIQVREYRG